MELKTAMQYRASCRAYKDQQISDAQLEAILDAAYLAPVGMGSFENVQLVVLQDKDKLDQLNGLFQKAVGNPDAQPTYGAPTLIIVCEKKEMDDMISGSNAGCIIENMTLAACAEGLGSVYLRGMFGAMEDNEEANALFGTPEGYRAVSAAAVGIPAEEPVLREVVKNKMVTIR